MAEEKPAKAEQDAEEKDVEDEDVDEDEDEDARLQDGQQSGRQSCKGLLQRASVLAASCKSSIQAKLGALGPEKEDGRGSQKAKNTEVESDDDEEPGNEQVKEGGLIQGLSQRFVSRLQDATTGTVGNTSSGERVVATDLGLHHVVTLLRSQGKAKKDVKFEEPVEDSSLWEMPERWQVRTGYESGVQRGVVRDFTDYKESQKHKWVLAALMLFVTILFLPPIRRGLFGQLWANPERLCLYRKSKLEDIMQIATDETNAQSAFEQLA